MTAPILRFKDQGRSYPDWVEKKIKDCVTFSKGGSLSKSDLSPHGATPCLLYGELYTTYGEVTKAVINKTDSTEDLVKSQMNDVILPMSGETAEDIAKATCIKQEGVAYGGDLMVLRSKSLDGCFLSYSLNSVNRRQISRIAQGKTVVHINPSRVSDISINIACLEEQQKIAAFFTALDEKIRLSEQKLNLISKIKKGIAQKLFAQDLRFKNKDGYFFDFWKSYTVGELVDVIGGGTPSTQNPDYWDGDIYWLTPTEINSKYVHSSNRKITFDGVRNSSAKLLPKGALLLTTRATLGACSINNQDNPVCTNQGFQSLVCKDGVDNEFMYYVVTDSAFQKTMIQRASGSTFLEISSKNLKGIVILLPSLEEQRQIATLLSSLDKKIDCLKQRVKALKTQKASFMQQMFV